MISDHLRVIHESGILGHGLDHRDDIQLLHALLADPLAVDHIQPFDLAGNDKEWGRLQPGTGHPGQSIRSTGACGHHTQADPVVHSGIGLGCNGTGLLVKTGHKLYFFAFPERVVQVHGTAARQHKHVPGSGFFQFMNDIIRQFYHICCLCSDYSGLPVKIAWRDKADIHSTADRLPEVPEHAQDFFVQLVPFVVRVQRRKIFIRIAFVVPGPEAVKAGYENIRDAENVKQTESRNYGIVKMRPAAFDDTVIVHDALVFIRRSLNI